MNHKSKVMIILLPKVNRRKGMFAISHVLFLRICNCKWGKSQTKSRYNTKIIKSCIIFTPQLIFYITFFIPDVNTRWKVHEDWHTHSIHVLLMKVFVMKPLLVALALFFILTSH